MLAIAEWLLKQVVWFLVVLLMLAAGGCVTAQDILEQNHLFTLEAREGVHYHQWEGWQEF